MVASSGAQRRQDATREPSYFEGVRRAERRYEIQLRRIAKHVADIVYAFPAGDPQSLPALMEALERYAEAIDPWARATASTIIADVAARDARAWLRHSRAIGASLREEIASAPIGSIVQRLIAEQTDLIKSIPRDAAARAQKLTLDIVQGGRRYDEAVPMIQDTGRVTRSRATMIARTETARAQSAIVQARAMFVGSDQYRWMTVRDADVRRAHRRLHGKVFNWNDPPVAEDGGQRHHPGDFPNCRCYADPLLT